MKIKYRIKMSEPGREASRPLAHSKGGYKNDGGGKSRTEKGWRGKTRIEKHIQFNSC